MQEMYSVFWGLPSGYSVDLRGNWSEIMVLRLDLENDMGGSSEGEGIRN